MLGFLEVFERQVRRGLTWAPVRPAAPFCSDAEGLLTTGVAHCPSGVGPDLPDLSSLGGWAPANESTVQTAAEHRGARLLNPSGWLTACSGDNSDFEGWQYADTWTSEFGSTLVRTRMSGNSNVRRRRWLRPVVPEGTVAELLTLCRHWDEHAQPAEILVHLHAVRHVLMLVHGVGAHDHSSMQRKVAKVRHSQVALQQAGFDLCNDPAPDGTDRGPCTNIDVCGVSWYDGSATSVLGRVAAGLDQIHVKGVPAVRELVHKTLLNAALYLGGYREHIQAAMAAGVNVAFAVYVAAHPAMAGRQRYLEHLIPWYRGREARGTGGAAAISAATSADAAAAALQQRGSISPMSSVLPQGAEHVSVWAHSLGSVIVFDLLCQRPTGLSFLPAGLFAMGSPIGMYLTLRNASPAQLTSYLKVLAAARLESNTDNSAASTTVSASLTAVSATMGAPDAGPSSVMDLPHCGAVHSRVFNIFHALDPLAYLLSPVLWNADVDGPPPRLRTIAPYNSPQARADYNAAVRQATVRRGSSASQCTPARGSTGGMQRPTTPWAHMGFDSEAVPQVGAKEGTPHHHDVLEQGITGVACPPSMEAPRPPPLPRRTASLATAPVSHSSAHTEETVGAPGAASMAAPPTHAPPSPVGSARSGQHPSSLAIGPSLSGGLDITPGGTSSPSLIASAAVRTPVDGGLRLDAELGSPATTVPGPLPFLSPVARAYASGVDFVLPAGNPVASGVLSSTIGAIGEYVQAVAAHKVYWSSPDCLAVVLARVMETEAEAARGGRACTCGAAPSVT